jgi:acylphosphatase
MTDRPAASSANESDGQVERRRVVYSGRVQGVGFRARTMHAARRFAVAGWVRNRIDGDVELVVEGAKEQIDAFLGEVALRMASNIERVEMHQEQPTGELQGFSVKE